MGRIKALIGGYASAEAMRQINPDVVAAYPITPQTSIVEKFSQFVADGRVDTEFVRVESEHSAMSAVVGASAAGARAMTASASQGIALMWEVLHIASGLRLPIVMSVVDRALSAPINIHCDHQDTMGCRDAGWIQIYCENGQEVYDNTILAVRLAERVKLPVMICQDGFITSHCTTPVEVMDDKSIRRFIGTYRPKRYLLNPADPITMGPLQLPDSYFETKKEQMDAMKLAKLEYIHVGKELSKLTGKKYGYLDTYKVKDADAVIVVMSSSASTARVVVDKLRAEKKKVGLLKVRLFRPFPYKAVANALKGINSVGVLDRAVSHGAESPLLSEIKSAVFELQKKPVISGAVFGLGGRDLMESDIALVFRTLLAKRPLPETIGCKTGGAR